MKKIRINFKEKTLDKVKGANLSEVIEILIEEMSEEKLKEIKKRITKEV
jgi:protein subunit release factor A